MVELQCSGVHTIDFTFKQRPYCDLLKLNCGRVVVLLWPSMNAQLIGAKIILAFFPFFKDFEI